MNDSAAARDFAALLPLTLNLSDFHQTERISDLPRPLSTAGAPRSAEPKAGDLAFYAPWGNLAITTATLPARTAWSSSAAWPTAAPRCSPRPAGSPSNAERRRRDEPHVRLQRPGRLRHRRRGRDGAGHGPRVRRVRRGRRPHRRRRSRARRGGEGPYRRGTPGSRLDL
ncbi:cyclophilin-like fold protein [Amycolatopsis vastitatis]|uniref:cyclophilin-like fold protein n=1 Tax=Amycolatopsis vastitatis TaxID=1905142 RepID=UPI0034DED7FF